MSENLNKKAQLIEVEESDIREFLEGKDKFDNAVHIQLVLTEEEALEKNKTGDLGLLNEYMIEQNIILNLMSTQYTETFALNLKACNKPQDKENLKNMMKYFRDDARMQLKEAGFENYENCAYALDPYLGGSANMFLNEPRETYARERLTELLRMHVEEIIPGKNHVLELVVAVQK